MSQSLGWVCLVVFNCCVFGLLSRTEKLRYQKHSSVKCVKTPKHLQIPDMLKSVLKVNPPQHTHTVRTEVRNVLYGQEINKTNVVVG